MSEFRLEHGRRYVTRDGRVTDGPIIDLRPVGVTESAWSFVGSIGGSAIGWHPNGRMISSDNIYDLVREYTEPRYEPFTAADYVKHLHGRVIIHPVHGPDNPQVIAFGDSKSVRVAPVNVWVDYDYLVECRYEDTGKPVAREVQS